MLPAADTLKKNSASCKEVWFGFTWFSQQMTIISLKSLPIDVCNREWFCSLWVRNLGACNVEESKGAFTPVPQVDQRGWINQS